MDVVASFPADSPSAEAVRPGDGALDQIAEDAQAGADASFGDGRSDLAPPQQAAVLLVVVVAVGEECVRPVSGPADGARHGRTLVQQR
ncbi:hypothetical protein [Streptomyces albidoflavus]|uniref:hypothetical protein n=1 Tax=Streptomyces albidoflavus TaxID=1886 RepID=UPI003CECBCE5